MDTTIEQISGQEILDSRGNPTIEVEVILEALLHSGDSIHIGAYPLQIFVDFTREGLTCGGGVLLLNPALASEGSLLSLFTVTSISNSRFIS